MSIPSTFKLVLAVIADWKSRVYFQAIRVVRRESNKNKVLTMDNYQPSKRSTFMYFAYGSNLWTDRIRLQNPSAIRKSIATLKVQKFPRLTLNLKNFIFRFVHRVIELISIIRPTSQPFGMVRHQQLSKTMITMCGERFGKSTWRTWHHWTGR